MNAGEKIEASSGIYRLNAFESSDVIVAFSGREYRASEKNLFLKELGIPENRLALVKQVHGEHLLKVEDPEKLSPNTLADGMVTCTEDVALGVLTADCVPVFFWDSKKNVIGIVHAGWRGVLHKITGKMLQAFQLNFKTNPSDVQVALGPAIRKCCYEVSDEFNSFFPEFYEESLKKEKHGHLDLVGAIVHNLKEQGVLENNIYDSGICTVCKNKKFFSYRSESKTKERMLSVIYIKKKER